MATKPIGGDVRGDRSVNYSNSPSRGTGGTSASSPYVSFTPLLTERNYSGSKYHLSLEMPESLLLKFQLDLEGDFVGKCGVGEYVVYLVTSYATISPSYVRNVEWNSVAEEHSSPNDEDSSDGRDGLILKPADDGGEGSEEQEGTEGKGKGRIKKFRADVEFPIAIRDLSLDAKVVVRSLSPPSSLSPLLPTSIPAPSPDWVERTFKIYDDGMRIKQGTFRIDGCEGKEIGEKDEEKNNEVMAKRMEESDYWLDSITSSHLTSSSSLPNPISPYPYSIPPPYALYLTLPRYPSPVIYSSLTTYPGVNPASANAGGNVHGHVPHSRSTVYLQALKTLRECAEVLEVLEEDERVKGIKGGRRGVGGMGKRTTLRLGYYKDYATTGNNNQGVMWEKGMTDKERRSLIGWYNRKLQLAETSAMCDVVEERTGEENPEQYKYRVMSRGGKRGLVDTGLRPDIGQKEEIRRILARPSDYLTSSEKDLLWRFRFSLVDDKKALCKFLLSVDWKQATEVIQAAELLNQWRKRAPIDITDALKLLSGSDGFRRTIVREYAVETLAGCSDKELSMFLLQLVMAIKYEIFEEDEDADDEDNDEGMEDNESEGEAVEAPKVQVGTLGRFLIKRAMTSTALANYLFWYLIVECEDPTYGVYYKAVFEALKTEMAKTSLDSREKNSSVSSERGSIVGDKSGHHHHDNVFSGVFKKMTDALQGSEHHHGHQQGDGKQGRSHRGSSDGLGTMLGLFHEQLQFFMGIMTEQIKARDSKGKKAQKESALRVHLSKYTNVSGRVGLLPVPLCPEVEVLGVKSEACFMFRSALYPAVVTFRKNPDVSVLEEEVERRREEMTKRTSLNNKKISKLLGEERDIDERELGKGRKSRNLKGLTSEIKNLPPTNSSRIVSRTLNEEYSVIFKSGDDLRQDQLIIVMIRLFDNLLKAEGLDLCLTPYSILATSPTTGLVEFVKGSLPISAVLATHGTIQEYFTATNQVEDIPAVRESYIRSCAGYCVMTYILGIGDRHLDNIMMLPSGRFFHIDFGFIFGRDPKPMPPAFRLTQSMVDGFGGDEGFLKFKRLCGQVYNILRRSAGLVVNLLHLSKEGSVPDLSFHPTLTPNEVIEKVEEKFRLDLNDEQAEAFFHGLIAESLGALAPRVLEV
eukprot:CAMPEP_0118646972 /NCGR_PEP_ID=MMETSP0785-20121206/8356_1 /TAXON_ID=91992 /ORGANISM="Bolidomonas pacifica, Strain CCMP 1866" /LENGTH=1145 /DNA_ID=CAMNT_0006539031 /DNA_START=160 /DNA_END=3594 /DNA_ORIENTATION=-